MQSGQARQDIPPRSFECRRAAAKRALSAKTTLVKVPQSRSEARSVGKDDTATRLSCASNVYEIWGEDIVDAARVSNVYEYFGDAPVETPGVARNRQAT
jgi:hypothetical protein